jgi:hypothetical protein
VLFLREETAVISSLFAPVDMAQPIHISTSHLPIFLSIK